jgi:cytochrome c oxidase subunit 2
MLGNAIRICSACLLAGLAIAPGCPWLASGPDQNVQLIEVTAKKYEFNPSPIRVKQGAKVQLKITALDRAHGFKINLYPDRAKTTGAPGLVFASQEDCFTLEKGTPTTVEFVAQSPGTYSFKCCNFCGMGHGGMKGKLIVEP